MGLISFIIIRFFYGIITLELLEASWQKGTVSVLHTSSPESRWVELSNDSVQLGIPCNRSDEYGI